MKCPQCGKEALKHFGTPMGGRPFVCYECWEANLGEIYFVSVPAPCHSCNGTGRRWFGRACMVCFGQGRHYVETPLVRALKHLGFYPER